MSNNSFVKRSIAKALIVALLNPYYYVPAARAAGSNNALAERDTALFSGFDGSSGYGAGAQVANPNVGKPTVVMLLDTSRSMNLPEEWKEYPGAYDSHVEYLWNDIDAISTTLVNTLTDSKISILPPTSPDTPTSGWGYWGKPSRNPSGQTYTPTDLWEGVSAYAQGTEPNKSGSGSLTRSIYRNYKNASWLYWLPEGTDTSDLRLSSVSFNRFRGANLQLSGSYDLLKINPTYGFEDVISSIDSNGVVTATATNWAQYNACQASASKLTPSTVLAPTTYPRNDGYYTGKWLRWEPYTDLTMTYGSKNLYPGSSAVETGTEGYYAQGYIRMGYATPPQANQADDTQARDSYPTTNSGGSAATALGITGLPIRYSTSSSVAKWEGPKADMGGFYFRKHTDDASNLAVLNEVLSWYGLTSTSASIQDARFVAWGGNRAIDRNTPRAPGFGSETGIGAYYDEGPYSPCAALTGPVYPSSGSPKRCVKYSYSAPLWTMYLDTNKINCVNTATDKQDAVYRTFKVGGACELRRLDTGQKDPALVAGDCTGDLNGDSASPNCSEMAPLCTENPETTPVVTADYNSCALMGAQPYNLGTCTLSDSSIVVGSCGSPTGQSSVVVNQCTGSSYYVDDCRLTGGYTIPNCSPTGREWNESAQRYDTTGCSAGSYGSSYCSGDGPTCSNGNSHPGSAVLGQTCSSSTPSYCNAQCVNTKASGTYYTDCSENDSSSSCSSPPSCYNVVEKGTRYYDGSCSNAMNNTCTQRKLGSYSIRGGSYDYYECSPSTTPGTYYRGGSCSGGAPECRLTPESGPVTINGQTYYTQRATCSAPLVGTQNLDGECKGKKTSLNGSTIDASSTLSSSNCLWDQQAVQFNGPHTYITNCRDKADDTNTCTGQWGVSKCVASCTLGGTVSLSHQPETWTRYYRAYPFKESTEYLTHDCAGDSDSKKLRADTLSLATQWSDAVGGQKPYINNGTEATSAQATVYSVNWLNWKFGAKVCYNAQNQIIKTASQLSSPIAAGITCNPIGRKTRLQTAKDVLVELVDSLNSQQTGMNLGLMIFNSAEKNTGGITQDTSDGAHVVVAAGDVSSNTHAANLKDKILKLQAGADTPLTEAVFEAYQYFLGNKPQYGGGATSDTSIRGVDYDYVKVDSSVSPGVAVTAGRDTGAVNNSRKYIQPSIGACGKNALVLISDGAPTKDGYPLVNNVLKTDRARKLHSKLLADPDSLPGLSNFSSVIANSGRAYFNSGNYKYQFKGDVDSNYPARAVASSRDGEYVYLDELTYYMANPYKGLTPPSSNKVEPVETITIGMAGVDSEVLRKSHTYGGMTYQSATDATGLAGALGDVFDSLSRWAPVGNVSTVSYDKTLGKSDAIYVSAFEVTTPKVWDGTIKKYQFGFDADSCGTASNNCPNTAACMMHAGSGDLGNCKKNAEEYYVDTGRNSISIIRVRADAQSKWISQPDGAEGAKGGTGDRLKAGTTPDSRKLYTHITGVGTENLTDALNAVSVANQATLAPYLDEADAVKQAELIKFARGSARTGGGWRTWAHFDSVHSKPAEDTASNTLYYMTSDGVLHAVDTTNGNERWAFMVEEALPQIKSFADATSAVTGNHIEVADGSPVVVEVSTSKKLVVFGMRRGGRSYYALDVSSINAPKFAWKITGGGSGTNVFRNLGQTWSTPVVAKIRGHKDSTTGKPKPVLIFGGGYDEDQDKRSPGRRDSMGNSVFIVDAADPVNSLHAEISLGDYSVASDVKALDATGDAEGTIDRLYVGDLGGGLWRIDTDDRSDTNPSSAWKSLRIANFTASSGPRMKIFQRPEVAPVKKSYKRVGTDNTVTYETQIFDAVFVGVGDTQRPFSNSGGYNDGTTISGAMFMVKDTTVSGVPTGSSGTDWGSMAQMPTDFVDLTDQDTQTEIDSATTANSLATKKGWVVKFTDGEFSTSPVTVVAGKIYFGTYKPPTVSSGTGCGLGVGYGRNWAMSALDALPVAVASTTNSGGRVSSVGYGYASNPAILGKAGSPNIVLGGPGIASQNVANQNATRVYWYSVPER